MAPMTPSAPHAPPGLRIEPVASRRSLGQFIRVPSRVLGSDPAWIQPLTIERRMHLSPRTNPYFSHARWQAWLAVRDGEPVGRISAQIDALHLERHDDATGFFGMLDAEDRDETFRALLETAEQWLRTQGMRRARGPFNLSINEETGLLVDGFDTPPMFMMGHAAPYYGQHVEQCGYRKAKDMLAYMIRTDFTASAAMQRLVERFAPRIRIRPLRRERFDADIALLRDVFNDAWAANWGFVPFTEEEFAELGRNLKFLVPRELVQVAEVDGEPAAFIVALPNVNEAIRDLRGRLLPLGWLKLLWRIKARFPATVRVPLMGVRRRFQQTRMGPALAFLVIDAVRSEVRRRGVRHAELSWVLEDNAGMRSIIESIGGRAYKRYRVYEREL